MELDGQVRSSARALCWRWHGIKVRLCEDDTWRFSLRLLRLDESTRTLSFGLRDPPEHARGKVFQQ